LSAWRKGWTFASVERSRRSPTSPSTEIEKERQRLRRRLHITAERIIVGVDRLDYTKGLPERLKAFDRFLIDNPSWRGRVQYVGVAAPSRTHLQDYQDLGDLVDDLVEDINWRHGDGSWQPVSLFRDHANRVSTIALYSLGDVCMITSLHDGMNLVAKEYAATRVDDDGVLILSKFTGSALQLTDAIQVNPYDIAGMADALRIALEMDASERRARMKRMRDEVMTNNIYAWAGTLLSASVRLTADAQGCDKRMIPREASRLPSRRGLAASGSTGSSVVVT
jgi:trehalose 6-phosphate synthase